MPRNGGLIGAFFLIVRVMRIGNVLFLVAAILAFIATFVWTTPLHTHLVTRYGVTGGPALFYLRALMIAALPSVYIVERILAALATILVTMRNGNPFATSNTRQLQAIGWSLLALQMLDMLLGLSIWWAKSQHIRVADWQPSFTGWLGVLVAFVLARIFAQGAAMRDELEATV